MRWKVPAASGRPAACSHTRSSRPEATPAAHADRMLQTPPDIATRSQSAGRGVNRPAARPPPPPPWRAPAQLEPAALLRSIPGAGSFHPSGVSPSKGDRSCASPGGLPSQGRPSGAAVGFLPTTLGKCRPAHSALSPGSSLLFRSQCWRPCLWVEADAKVPHQPRPRPSSRGSPLLPGLSQGVLDRIPLAGPGASELPLGMEAARLGPGRPALCSGVDLLCDFRMSHLASLGFISSSWEVGRIESGLRMLVWGGHKCKKPSPGWEGESEPPIRLAVRTQRCSEKRRQALDPPACLAPWASGFPGKSLGPRRQIGEQSPGPTDPTHWLFYLEPLWGLGEPRNDPKSLKSAPGMQQAHSLTPELIPASLSLKLMFKSLSVSSPCFIVIV